MIDNPLRPFILIEDEGDRLRTTWPDDELARTIESQAEDRSLRPDLADRLAAYFRGEPVEFGDVPTPPGAEFTRRCWEACRTIPRGETSSYARLAEHAGGETGSARAAGQAMRHNPLPIIIPCHRVIATDGSLHGFSGSCDPESENLATKRWLLQLEGYRLEPHQMALFSTD